MKLRHSWMWIVLFQFQSSNTGWEILWRFNVCQPICASLSPQSNHQQYSSVRRIWIKKGSHTKSFFFESQVERHGEEALNRLLLFFVISHVSTWKELLVPPGVKSSYRHEWSWKPNYSWLDGREKKCPVAAADHVSKAIIYVEQKMCNCTLQATCQ